jgi:hypothetical protein
MEVSDWLHVPFALSSGQEPQGCVVHTAGWAPEPVLTLWSREESLALVRNRTLSSTPYTVTIEIELCCGLRPCRYLCDAVNISDYSAPTGTMTG